ncbi:MAG: hypothetical protein ACPGUV_11865 [Polyangiales bacterium]
MAPPAIASCGAACVPGDASGCAPGLYCSTAGLCTADCFADPTSDPDGQFACPNAEACTADGRCPSLATGADGSAGAGGNTNACPAVDLSITRPRPKVILAIDQSSSMQWTIDGTVTADRANGELSRYDELVLALLGDGTAGDPGLLRQFDNSIQMSAAFWTGHGDGTPDECPSVEQNMMLDYGNVAAIDQRMREIQAGQGNGIFGYTPTPESIQVLRGAGGVLENLISTPDEPVTLFLLTDGGPDTCANREAVTRGDPGVSLGVFEPVSAQTATELRALLTDQGIRTSVIGFGSANIRNPARGELVRQLKIMANGGQGYADLAGLDGNTDASAQAILATNRADLVAVMQSLFGDQLSCTVPFNGARIFNTSRACEGQVELNGRALTCWPVGTNAADGWRVNDDGTAIELMGSDCDALKASADVALRAFGFPCDVAGLI